MNSLVGTAAMIRLIVRRERVVGTAWAMLVVVLVVGTAVQYGRLFPDEPARAAFVVEVMGNAALTAFTGQILGTGLGNLVMWKIGDIAFTLVALMAVLTVVRHTRAEEESGRAELLGAGVLGRHAALTASLVVAGGLALLIGLLTALGLIGLGLDAPGSFTFGLALAAPGVVFAAIAAAAAQLTERARAAVGIACVALGVGYLVRFLADGSGLLGLRWWSTNGWSHLMRPYGGDDVAVVAVPLVVAGVTAAVAYRLAARRDVGAGILAARPGPADGGPRTPLALAWRLQRGQLVGWTIALAVIGAATAGVAAGIPEIADRGGAGIREFFRRYAESPDVGVSDTFIWLILLSVAGVAALQPMLAVLRLRSEETSGRAELTLSTAVSRPRWVLSHLVVAAAGTVVTMAVAGLAAGLVYGMSVGDVGTSLPRVIGAALILVPAMWMIGAITVFAVGAVPRAAAAVAWTVWMFVNVFGEILGPILGIDYGIANAFVPFHYVPKVLTGGEFGAGPVFGLAILSAVLVGVGLNVLRRRDIG